MFTAQVRKSGNSFVVTIPKEEAEHLGLDEGRFVAMHITPMDLRPALPPAWREALDQAWPWLKPGLNYLKDR